MSLLDTLNGYKTYMGGLGMMLWGLSDLMLAYYNEVPLDWNITMGKVFAGWLIISGRSTLEKIKEI